jgi:RAQPRD family integrative conjugative element protein
MRRTIWLGLGLLVVALLQSPISVADEELEHADLSKIVQVLDSLTPLVNQAEQQQDKNLRLQFNYDALRSDINKVKQGIRCKWQSPAIEPRPVTPIQGDYLQLQSKHA